VPTSTSPYPPLLVAVLVAALVACADEPADLPTTFGGDRPTELRVPADYDGSPAPLIVILHGYSASGAVQLAYSRLDSAAREHGALILAPDGTEDGDGNQFWTIDDADCQIGGAGPRPDDAGYLVDLVDEVSAVYAVDPGRVFVFGHSNGGFMAHRLACDHADRFAAIISLAGAPPLTADCSPDQPVGILQIHGDADDTVYYAGGDGIGGFEFPCAYPGAIDTVTQWADRNGCTGELADTGDSLDLVTDLAGDETAVQRVGGCAAAGVELWTIAGGPHIPALGNAVYQPMWEFLAANAR
jgi:polyhydroxybutyrate depolymerase